jgi:hypothetical protein
MTLFERREPVQLSKVLKKDVKKKKVLTPYDRIVMSVHLSIIL